MTIYDSKYGKFELMARLVFLGNLTAGLDKTYFTLAVFNHNECTLLSEEEEKIASSQINGRYDLYELEETPRHLS